jgi:hypothetical protein
MIRDTDNSPISTYIGAIAPSGVFTTTMHIDCEENSKLSSESTSAYAVEARKVGDASWTNLETTPIDLTPYAPARTAFQLRITAGAAISGRNRFAVRVGP